MPLLSENLPPFNPSPPSLQWPRAKALLSTQGLSQNQMPSRSATICDSLTSWGWQILSVWLRMGHPEASQHLEQPHPPHNTSVGRTRAGAGPQKYHRMLASVATDDSLDLGSPTLDPSWALGWASCSALR